VSQDPRAVHIPEEVADDLAARRLIGGDSDEAEPPVGILDRLRQEGVLDVVLAPPALIPANVRKNREGPLAVVGQGKDLRDGEADFARPERVEDFPGQIGEAETAVDLRLLHPEGLGDDEQAAQEGPGLHAPP